MKIGKDLDKILTRSYEADTMIERKMGRYDLAFKTDDQGRPILLFIGKRGDDGKIAGERFARRIVTDDSGRVIKSHWDNKGKV